MSVSISNRQPGSKSWVEDVALRNTQPRPPTRMQLRNIDPRKTKANVVSLSAKATQTVEYMLYHPIDFVTSTASSMVTFVAVKWLIVNSMMAMGLGVLAYPLAIAMLTSAVIGFARAGHKEFKERKRRLDKLQERENPPTIQELASARKINISAIVENGVQRALFTGVLSGILGIAIGHMTTEPFPHTHIGVDAAMDFDGLPPPVGSEYQNFLNKLAESESNGEYTMFKGSHPNLGKYQFTEAAMIDLGYYAGDGKNDEIWNGKWTGQDGIHSTEDFLKRGDIQEKAIRMYQERLWSYIVKHDLDRFVGETFINADGEEVEITKSGLLAGAHLVGPGRYGADGAEAGLALFLEKGEDVTDANGKSVKEYLEQFGGMPVPFEIDNPEIVVRHTLPISAELNPVFTDDHGPRTTPYRGWHAGVDLARVPLGTPVLASADGIVEEVRYGYNGGHGNTVRIRHFDGMVSHYGHLHNIDVKEGQFLLQGQKLGGVGNTGLSTGVHLHYGLYDLDEDTPIRNPDGSSNLRGKDVNPVRYIPELADLKFKNSYMKAGALNAASFFDKSR